MRQTYDTIWRQKTRKNIQKTYTRKTYRSHKTAIPQLMGTTYGPGQQNVMID